MKTSKTIRYIIYLLSITAVFSISLLMITIILLGFNTWETWLGVPISLLIVLKLKPYIGEYIYGEEDSVHKWIDKYDIAVEYGSLIIIASSIRFIFEKGTMPSYLLGEALEVTWLFTKIFVGGALLLQIIRYISELLDKIPSKTKLSLPKGKLY